ncbi:hypothetical protein SAMN04487898_105134 [Pedobacter sp. ok626]|nr:hypothetical protein SAMN04487898_105134 [Pedobacter sp. ok626]
MEFQRELYFSQTEACRTYKISVRKFKKIIKENGLNVIEDEFISHTIGGKPFEVKTIFVKKIDFIRAYI